jgi:hypothetical protein
MQGKGRSNEVKESDENVQGSDEDVGAVESLDVFDDRQPAKVVKKASKAKGFW